MIKRTESIASVRAIDRVEQTGPLTFQGERACLFGQIVCQALR
jgi:hypothetical protein